MSTVRARRLVEVAVSGVVWRQRPYWSHIPTVAGVPRDWVSKLKILHNFGRGTVYGCSTTQFQGRQHQPIPIVVVFVGRLAHT
jgi:hypothetical protein